MKHISLILLVALGACNIPYQDRMGDKQPVVQRDSGLIADSGMVVSAHPLASQVGVEILKKGGNAVDAAIAVQFALAVVYPNAGNIGGGGFAVIRMNSGEANALDFRETAPAKATRDMYLDKDGNVIPDKSSTGSLSAGVPGSVDGMVKLHERYGSLPWKELVQPAIELAENGFVITERQAKEFNALKSDFLKYNDPMYYSISLVKSDSEAVWVASDKLTQKDLAKTLKLIRDSGRTGFYEGVTAANIVKEMKRSGGIISEEDLKNYKSTWRDPIVGWYRGMKVITMPPSSSGGVALVQLLNMIENADLSGLGWNSDSYAHLLAEAEKRAYADRSLHLGDMDFYPVPVKELLDSNYIISRMNDFDPEHAKDCKTIKAGDFPSRPTPSPSGRAEVGPEETTHFSIVDKWHNAVSITTTINGSYGAGVFVPGSGFLLNNEMDDFSSKPGVPNAYGLIGAEANAIAPGKRMLSSMTPTILEKNGKLFMVVGTPGGSTIITSVFQTILNVVDHGMSMNEAVNAKKFHHQWRPDTIFVEENALDSITMAGLEKKGHHILKRGPIGRTDCILVLPNGKLEGGADRRGDDAAAGH